MLQRPEIFSKENILGRLKFLEDQEFACKNDTFLISINPLCFYTKMGEIEAEYFF